MKKTYSLLLGCIFMMGSGCAHVDTSYKPGTLQVITPKEGEKKFRQAGFVGILFEQKDMDSRQNGAVAQLASKYKNIPFYRVDFPNDYREKTKIPRGCLPSFTLFHNGKVVALFDHGMSILNSLEATFPQLLSAKEKNYPKDAYTGCMGNLLPTTVKISQEIIYPPSPSSE